MKTLLVLLLLIPSLSNGAESKCRQKLGRVLADVVQRLSGDLLLNSPAAEKEIICEIAARRDRLKNHPIMVHMVADRFHYETGWPWNNSLEPLMSMAERSRIMDAARIQVANELIMIEIDIAQRLGLSWERVAESVDSMFYDDTKITIYKADRQAIKAFVNQMKIYLPRSTSAHLVDIQYSLLANGMPAECSDYLAPPKPLE